MKRLGNLKSIPVLKAPKVPCRSGSAADAVADFGKGSSFQDYDFNELHTDGDESSFKGSDDMLSPFELGNLNPSPSLPAEQTLNRNSGTEYTSPFSPTLLSSSPSSSDAAIGSMDVVEYLYRNSACSGSETQCLIWDSDCSSPRSSCNKYKQYQNGPNYDDSMVATSFDDDDPVLNYKDEMFLNPFNGKPFNPLNPFLQQHEVSSGSISSASDDAEKIFLIRFGVRFEQKNPTTTTEAGELSNQGLPLKRYEEGMASDQEEQVDIISFSDSSIPTLPSDSEDSENILNLFNREFLDDISKSAFSSIKRAIPNGFEEFSEKSSQSSLIESCEALQTTMPSCDEVGDDNVGLVRGNLSDVTAPPQKKAPPQDVDELSIQPETQDNSFKQLAGGIVDSESSSSEDAERVLLLLDSEFPRKSSTQSPCATTQELSAILAHEAITAAIGCIISSSQLSATDENGAVGLRSDSASEAEGKTTHKTDSNNSVTRKTDLVVVASMSHSVPQLSTSTSSQSISSQSSVGELRNSLQSCKTYDLLSEDKPRSFRELCKADLTGDLSQKVGILEDMLETAKKELKQRQDVSRMKDDSIQSATSNINKESLTKSVGMKTNSEIGTTSQTEIAFIKSKLGDFQNPSFNHDQQSSAMVKNFSDTKQQNQTVHKRGKTFVKAVSLRKKQECKKTDQLYVGFESNELGSLKSLNASVHASSEGSVRLCEEEEREQLEEVPTGEYAQSPPPVQTTLSRMLGALKRIKRFCIPRALRNGSCMRRRRVRRSRDCHADCPALAETSGRKN